MSVFNWLGGSLSSPSSWSQPDPKNPVEPGPTDDVTISGGGTLTGSIGPADANLSGNFDLQGSIVVVGSTTLFGGSLTIEAGATYGGGTIVIQSGSVTQLGGTISVPTSGELFGTSTSAITFTQTGGANSTNLIELNSGAYELDKGSLSVGSLGEYIGDGAGLTGSFTQKGGTHTIASFLSLGFPGTGTYDLQGGTLTAPKEYIGQNGSGTFTQEGGTQTLSDRIVLGIDLTGGAAPPGTGSYTLGGSGSLSVQTIFIGSDPNCTGTFNFNVKAGDAATLTVSGTGGYPGLIVGGQGTGAFTQGAGSLNTTVAVGFRNTGVGTYNFNGGSLASSDEEIGVVGKGTFVQTAGTNTPTNNGLIVGSMAGSTGVYELQNGTLQSSSETIGASGAGTLTQTGGANEVTKSDLTVGNASGGNGAYLLHTGSLTIDAGNLVVGAQANSVGDFEFNATAGDSATLDLTKGTITVGDGGTGTFTQGGGALSANIVLGSQIGSDGTFTLGGGTLTSSNGDEVIGDAGTGMFTQTAGTNTIDTGALTVGNSGGDGTYNLGGTGALAITGGDFQIAVGGGSTGTFDFNTATGDNATLTIDTKVIEVGVHGKATFVQGSGTLNAKLIVGGQVGSNGAFKLNGGTVTAAGQVVGNDGSGKFTMSGGIDQITSGGDLILGAFAAGGGTFTLAKGALSDGGELVGYQGAGHFIESGGSNKISGAGSLLDLGVQTGAVGTYVFSAGTLAAILETVGDAGTGTFTQKGTSANTVSGAGAKLDIGAQSGGSGSYLLQAGTLKAPVEVVGDAGKGAFTQSGGTNSISGTGARLDIGAQTGSIGSYILQAGKLTTPVEIVGDAGKGMCTQKGTGAITFSGTAAKLDMGAQASGVGTYLLHAGTLKVLVEIVGDAGTGTLTQSGGANTATGAGSKLDIGAQSGSHGNYGLGKGAVSALLEVVGDTGTGVFTQKGASTNTLSGTGAKLDLGAQSGGKGTYTLGAGALNALVEIVGDGGTGAFVQKNGTNTIKGTGSKLDLGLQPAGQGSYELDLGTLKAPTEIVGDAGAGTFNQKGGTNAISGALDVGAQTNATGLYSLVLGNLSAAGETVGDSGKGQFTQTGGANLIKGNLTIGNKSAGIYQLSGGSVIVKNVTGSTSSVALGVAAGSSGALSAANATLTAPTLIIGSGGTGQVTSGAGGVINVAHAIDIASGSTLTSTAGSVDVGTGVTATAGMIKIGSGGSLVGAGAVTGALAETALGKVQAQGGVLTIAGAVTGGGKLLVADGATLDLAGSDANTVAYLGAAGILKLEQTATISANITKLRIGDIIDIAGATITKAKRVGGTLTLTKSDASTLVLHVSGTFAGTIFAVQSDGHGGSDIVLEAKPPALAGGTIAPKTPVALFGQYVAAGFKSANDWGVGTAKTDIHPASANPDLMKSHI